MEDLQKSREIAKILIRTHFRNDYGEPFEAADGQADIFNLIYTKQFPRNQVIAATQYGKSEIVSMALLMRTEVFADNFAIVSGSKEKAQIIMSAVIQHAFDHPRFYKKLQLDKSVELDRLRRERSKDNISWMGGGSIKTFTANTRNKNQVKEALTGMGAQNIIEDEASLIPDDVQAMILRMLGGHRENFLLKIGNPFYRNHFLKSWQNSKYHKVMIDYNQALREGRYTKDFIEEMRHEAFFDVLYECKFPEKDNVLADGYRTLITDSMLEEAFITEEQFKDIYCTRVVEGREGRKIRIPAGQPKTGHDFAGGGNDSSAHVIRWPKVLKLLDVNDIADTMQQIPIMLNIQQDYGVEDRDMALDYGGLGQGVGDRMREKDHFVNNVMFGESAPGEINKAKYKNMRAYMYHELYKWLLDGGKIVKSDRFYELNVINYKEDSEKRFQIQPKKDLKKLMKMLGLTATSPDVADAAALTFADSSELIDEDDIDLL